MYLQLRCPLPADQWTQQKIERDHVRDHQNGHVDDRNRVGDAQSRYRAGLPRFGGEAGPVLRGWQTTPWRLRCHLPSERSVRGAAAYCLADGLPSSRRNGISGPTGMYSWSRMFFLASGKDSMMDVASAPSLVLRRKIPPLPSSRAYHSRIFPSRWSWPVARFRAGMTAITCSRFTPGFAVSRA